MADYATLLRDHVTLTCRSIDRLFVILIEWCRISWLNIDVA